MKRPALAAGLMLLAAPALAQPGLLNPLEGPAEAPIRETAGYGLGPLRMAFGPQDDGGLGAILRGSGVEEVGFLTGGGLSEDDLRCRHDESGRKVLGAHWTRIGYVELAADAAWSSAAAALNNASISLQPAWMFGLMSRSAIYCGRRPRVVPSAPADGGFRRPSASAIAAAQDLAEDAPSPILDLGPFLDIRYRFGSVRNELATVEVNQLIVGGGLQFLLWYDPIDIEREPLKLRASYYEIQDTATVAVDLPAEILENHVALTAMARLNLPWPSVSLGQSPLKLDADVQWSKPLNLDGARSEYFRQLQVWFDSPGAVKPVLSYRSGTETGLEYDQQFLLGALWEFAPH